MDGTTAGRRPGSARDVSAVLDRLAAAPGRKDRLTHVEMLPARAATTAPWPEWADPAVRTAYAGQGVRELWTHQAVAADAGYAGSHVVLATGTASGKSLAYQLPALSTILQRRRPRAQRGATVLYLAPTKALAHDQSSAVRSLGLEVRATTHDGDSSREEREWSRAFAEYLLTNPDMLHRSLLPRHQRWADVPGPAAVRGGRRVSSLSGRLRRTRRAGAAPAQAGVCVVRRRSHVHPRVRDGRRARGRGCAAHRPRRPGRDPGPLPEAA
ncbi:MAG: DEAD/DEAH box helicase [Nocardioides sp.]